MICNYTKKYAAKIIEHRRITFLSSTSTYIYILYEIIKHFLPIFMVYSFTFVYFRFFYLSVFFNIKNRFYYYFSNHNILYVSPECLSTYVQTIIVTCDTLKVFYYEMFNMERSVKAFGGYRTYFIQWR